MQWISLASNIGMMGIIAHLLKLLFNQTTDTGNILLAAAIGLIAPAVRFVCALAVSRMGYLSSKAVKSTLREAIYKKLLNEYRGQYTALGDTFLDNLQGLTTMKIYQTDALRHERMNEESENFRKITMKVLTMQLNSITIMDLIAYGGAAIMTSCGRRSRSWRSIPERR